MSERLLYSRKNAAEALSLSVRAIDYLLAAGEFKTVRVGKKNLIPAAELKKFAGKGVTTALTTA